MIPIQNTATGATFAVNVHPHAKKNAIAGELGDALKLSVAAPASDGRAPTRPVSNSWQIF